MKLNKKVIESMTVAATLAVMSTFTAFAGSTEDNTGDAVRVTTALDKNGTAGIIVDLNKMGSKAINQSGMITASIERTQTEMVSSSADSVLGEDVASQAITESSDLTLQTPSEDMTLSADQTVLAEAPVQENVPEVAPGEAASEAPEETQDEAPAIASEEATAIMPEETPANDEWSDRLMANVDEDMNIRTQPGEDAELAGKLFRGDVAEVVSVEGDWTQITSGNVTGYVKNEYCVYGGEAEVLAEEVCTTYATVNTAGLRLRSEPSEDASVVKSAAEGDKLKVDKETAPVDGWVPVQTNDATAFVSAEYVSVELNLGAALTSEEVAAKEAEEAKNTKKPAASANSDEVTLLAALIQCEAGNGSYEGMLAVGSVVMNRVRSGAYPNSISGVVYQSGQFPPALSGNVANVAAGGVKSSCMQAAQEAINGTDNTNGAVSFRSASSGVAGTLIGANVFF